MMWRWLAVVLAGWLAVASPAEAAAGRGTASFIDAMTVPLAVDPASALASAEQELVRVQARRSRFSGAEVQWVTAQAQFRLGNHEESKAALTRARELAPAGPQGLRVRGYSDLLSGLLSRGEGDFAGALVAVRQAQQSFIAVRDRRGHALAIQSLGVLYNDAGNAAEALRYFRLAEETYNDDDVFRLSLNNNLGVALQKLEQFGESEQRLVIARTSAQRLGIASFIRQINLNIAANQAFSGNPVGSLRSLDEFERAGEATAWQLSEADRIRALVAWRQARKSDALRYIDSSLGHIRGGAEGAATWPMHYLAYQIFDDYGLRDRAYTQLQIVRRIETQDAELTASNRAALLSAQFQFAAQNAQIAQLKADNLEREVKFQRTMTVTIVIGSVLALGLLVALLIIAIRARNRARADGAELAVANQRLERALAAKTEFLASTSHELRTPLNGILGMAQILLADGSVSPRHRTQIELLHDAGTTMRMLVDDILDVAKIEHGGFVIAPRPTEVGALVERVTRMFAAQAQTAGLALACDIPDAPVLTMVDADRLTQILFNLVGNALKFTPEGSVTIALRTEAASGEDPAPSHIVLAVRDTGIGIAPEWHEAVFDMFRQVDGARTRNYGGTGLGLAICRQLARAMDGDILLDSVEGEGSTFSVSLPMRPVPALQAVGDGDPAGEATLATDGNPVAPILVVASDPMRVAMLGAIVRRAGHAFDVADSVDKLLSVSAAKGLTLLVDAPAWHLVSSGGGQLCKAGNSLIVVGDALEEGPVTRLDSIDVQHGGVRYVRFSRNAIVAALETALSCDNPSATGVLALPLGKSAAIADADRRAEPQRPISMSRK
jgi:signal transduction histidine kinase